MHYRPKVYGYKLIVGIIETIPSMEKMKWYWWLLIAIFALLRVLTLVPAPVRPHLKDVERQRNH
jgi:hypothetical protein